MKIKITQLTTSVFIFVFIFSLSTQAQNAQQQSKITLGIKGGINLFTLSQTTQTGSYANNKYIVGVNAGINAEIYVLPDFYIQPGLLFSTEGGKIFSTQTKYAPSYLNIPVYALYKPTIENVSFLLGAGPYVGFGLGGNVKPSEGNNGKIYFRNNITDAQAASADAYFKNPDAGISFLGGAEFENRMSVQLNLQLGFLNLAPKINGQSSNNKIKNSGYSLSIGYRFKKI